MPTHLRLLFVLLLAGWLAAPAQARLGETLAEIKKRYSQPVPQDRKDIANWLFEVEDGQLVYTVTFDAKGLSIAEGLKPVKRARFSKDVALDFIESQLAPYRDSKTMRVVAPGGKYMFAGKELTCAQNEYVVVDEPQAMLLIWIQTATPTVMVVRPEIFRRTN